MIRLARAALALSAALGLAAAIAPRDAGACINGVEEERRYLARHEPPARVARADKALDRGRYSAAAAEVLSAYPGIRARDARTAAPIERRALRVLALAIVRSDGKAGSDGWPRWGNLEWAVATLAELEEAKGGNPAAQADLAEARASLPREHARALAVLEDLDRRDLMGSLHAYTALARLRLERGDEGGALAAVRRCFAMSTERTKCALPTGERS